MAAIWSSLWANRNRKWLTTACVLLAAVLVLRFLHLASLPSLPELKREFRLKLVLDGEDNPTTHFYLFPFDDTRHVPPIAEGMALIQWNADTRKLRIVGERMVFICVDSRRQLDTLRESTVVVRIRRAHTRAAPPAGRRERDAWFRVQLVDRSSDSRLLSWNYSGGESRAITSNIPTGAKDWADIVYRDGANSMNFYFSKLSIYMGTPQIDGCAYRDVEFDIDIKPPPPRQAATK